MRLFPNYSLWIGHVGDVRNLRSIHDAGIEAIVDLAMNEPIPTLTRELVYCRIPLVDGGGNPSRIVQLAVQTVTELLRTQMPTLVYCSGGMSRSVGIAAAAVACLESFSLDHALLLIAGTGPKDVSTTFYNDLRHVVEA